MALWLRLVLAGTLASCKHTVQRSALAARGVGRQRRHPLTGLTALHRQTSQSTGQRLKGFQPKTGQTFNELRHHPGQHQALL